MTEESVEGQTPSSEEQPPVTPAPVSEKEEEQLSPQGSQEEVLAKIADVENQLRGLQSKQDKTDSFLEKRLLELGVSLTPQQAQQNEVLNMRDEIAELKGQTLSDQPVVSGEEQTNVDLAEVAPVTLQVVKDLVEEAMKPPATGASVVSQSGGITPLSKISAEEAAKELDNLRPMSQRTEQEMERTEELLQIISDEVDK